jgi:desulfoferrodoxin-like iron-binding protein
LKINYKANGLDYTHLQGDVRSFGGELMTNVGELYVCKICGNTVEVVASGAGRLVCCGQEMELIGNVNDEEEQS